MKTTTILPLLAAASILTASPAHAQGFYARSKLSGSYAASTPPNPSSGAWRYVIERTYDCRGKGGWLDVQYLPACVVSNSIAPASSCTGTKPAPMTESALADPAASGCPILTERNLI